MKRFVCYRLASCTLRSLLAFFGVTALTSIIYLPLMPLVASAWYGGCIAIAALTLPLATAIWTFHRRWKMTAFPPEDEPPRCGHCGCNLTGLPEPRCPECGTRIEFDIHPHT